MWNYKTFLGIKQGRDTKYYEVVVAQFLEYVSEKLIY
jgi:hypothetical protein